MIIIDDHDDDGDDHAMMDDDDDDDDDGRPTCLHYERNVSHIVSLLSVICDFPQGRPYPFFFRAHAFEEAFRKDRGCVLLIFGPQDGPKC